MNMDAQSQQLSCAQLFASSDSSNKMVDEHSTLLGGTNVKDGKQLDTVNRGNLKQGIDWTFFLVAQIGDYRSCEYLRSTQN